MADVVPISITIKNLPQIRAAFKQAPYLMVTELSNAVKKTLFSIEHQAKVYAPVDTGILRASIRSKFQGLKGEVGANVTYDSYVQLGTKYQNAQPYLFSAAADTEDDVDKFFKDAVDNVLDKIGRAT